MQRTVEILLVIGVLVNLIKGADLILRPHQQKWLQDKFDTLALRLDYTKPLDWYDDRIIKKVYAAVTVILIVGGSLSFLSLGWFHWIWGGIAILFVLSTIQSMITAPFETEVTNQEFRRSVLERMKKEEWDSKDDFFWHKSKLIEMKLADWVTGSKTVSQHLYRPLLMVLVSQTIYIVSISTILIPYNLVRRYFGVDIESNLTLVISILVLAVLGNFIRSKIKPLTSVLSPVAKVGSISFFIFLVSLFIITAEFTVKILRGIVWRIAEHNKGAFAAIVLIITIALGVAEFYLKYQPTKTTAPVISTPSPTPQ